MQYIKYFSLFLFVFFQAEIYGQKDTINKKYHFKKTGYWEHKWPNGTTKSQGYYVGGKEWGYWKYYFKDGKDYLQGTMIDGKKNGTWYLTSIDDNVKIDATFWRKGKPAGGATLSW